MTLDKAASAGLWATIEAGSRQSVNFAVTLVLARLLAPEDFGIVAIAAFFANLTNFVLNAGFSAALVQRSRTSIEEESAIFWWNLIASILIAVPVVLLGTPLADYYGFPILEPLMYVVAGQLVLSSFGLVQSALFLRQMEFAILAKAGFVSAVVSGLLAIAAAAWGAGAWALGIQMGASSLIGTALIWKASGWRPVCQLQPGTLKPFFNFSAMVSLSGFLEILYAQGFGLLIAKIYGPGDLGLYERARALNLLPSSFITGIISRLALPIFSQQNGDRDAQRSGMRRASGFAMLINLPIMAGLAVLSDLVIQVLFGSRWMLAAPILAILSLGGMLLPIHAINLQLLLAQGGANAYFRIEIAKKLTGLLCLLVGSRYGIIGLAWGMTANSVLALFLNTYLTRRSIAYGLSAQLVDLAGPVFCTAAMAAMVILLRPVIALPPAAALALLVLAGGLSYVALCWSLRLRSFREALEVGAILLDKRREPTTGEP